jgi:two-component system chemotaxis response regulator CheY
MAFRILVVDDSPVLRLMLQEMLEALGHQVIAQADSVASAIQAYKDNRPDLTTLDISLPDGDGLTALKEIKRIDPSSKVIVITGNDQKKLLEQVLQLKAVGVLRKPFDADDLAGIIDRVPGAAPRNP